MFNVASQFSLLQLMSDLLYKSEETVNASIVKFGSSGEHIGVVSARGLQHKAQTRRLKDILQTCYDVLLQFGMLWILDRTTLVWQEFFVRDVHGTL